MSEPSAPQPPVRSAARVLGLVDLLATSPGLPLSEIARLTDIPKSSCFDLLRTLELTGWAHVDADTGRYSLGIRALVIGNSFVESNDLVSATVDALDRVSQATKETVHLGQLDGTDIVYLGKRESEHPIRLYSAVGRRLPAHATALGKAILSTLADHALVDLLPARMKPLTDRTITRRSDLLAELQRVREQGFADDIGENSPDVACIAVPIRVVDTAGAISVSVPEFRMTPATRAHIIDVLRAERSTLESEHLAR